MKFIRTVGAGSLALILALGAGCLTPLRADCPIGTFDVVIGWGCYVDNTGYLYCGDIIGCFFPGIMPYPFAIKQPTPQPAKSSADRPPRLK